MRGTTREGRGTPPLEWGDRWINCVSNEHRWTWHQHRHYTSTGGVGEGRCDPGQGGIKAQKSRDCRGTARRSATCGDIDVTGL